MSVVEASAVAGRDAVTKVCAVSNTADANRPSRTKNRARRVLHEVLAGLNRLLGLEDFSRGDALRD